MRTAVETGPKGKKFVAYALDWPGLERNGKSDSEAIARMESYRSRYRKVADRAGLADAFEAETPATFELQYEGVGSNDFWGISFAQSELDNEAISVHELERQLSLLHACWEEFDAIADHVSAELQKGPRGGGRDRDHIVRHLLGTEIDWVRKLDIHLDLSDIYSPNNRREFHTSVTDEIRSRHAEGRPAQAKGGPPWALPFMIRHLAYHVMDHAWEMDDKDLSGKESI